MNELLGPKGIQAKRNYEREVVTLSKRLRKADSVNSSLKGNLKEAQKKINSQAVELRWFRVTNVIFMCIGIILIMVQLLNGVKYG